MSNNDEELKNITVHLGSQTENVLKSIQELQAKILEENNKLNNVISEYSEMHQKLKKGIDAVTSMSKSKGTPNKTKAIKQSSLDLPFLNKTEMVEILRDKIQTTIKATKQAYSVSVVHKGMKTSTLKELMTSEDIPLIITEDVDDATFEDSSDPLEAMREIISSYLMEHFDEVSGQLKCDGFCSRCPDINVVACFLA